MELIDRFGRTHDYLRISLTERCNLRCFYCMPEEGIAKRPRQEFMRTEELLEMAERFVGLGVKKIRLTGGEPLLRKDIGEILRALGKMSVELGITTNGILVDQHIQDFKDAGMRAINVSLDSLKPERQAAISRRDYFSRIHGNIHRLIEEGFHVKVNAVVMRGVNDDEVGDFVAWTEHLPLHVRFIEFMPFDGNAWNWEKKVSAAEMMDRIQTRYWSIRQLEGQAHDTARVFQAEGHAGTFGIISPVTNPFCDTCNRIRLTADGKIKNCLFAQSETDLLSAMRRGEDITPLIISAVWDKKAARGGIESFEHAEQIHRHRSMIAIGG